MIIVERKSLEALEEMTKDCGRLLVLGCETCSAMCLAGGRRQVAELASAIRMARKMSQKIMSKTRWLVAMPCFR
ncbi:MAG: hypothetical protein JRF64_05085 [Deltaproteobacteria bacterium]|nr:hypothetical protein [Deltaproteobacteria bacterium]